MNHKFLLVFAALLFSSAASAASAGTTQRRIAELVKHKLSKHELVLDLEHESEAEWKAGKKFVKKTAKGAKKAAKKTAKVATSAAKGTAKVATTAAKGTVEVANDAADLAKKAFDEGIDFFKSNKALDCVKKGPVNCVNEELLPSSMKTMRRKLEGALPALAGTFGDIFSGITSLANAAVKGVGCADTYRFPYPHFTGPDWGTLPPFGLQKKTKEMCSRPSYDFEGLKDAARDLKEDIMDSTLLNDLLGVGGGSSLLQLGENSTARTGAALMGTPCSNNVGAFSISIGPEGSFKGAAAFIGVQLVAGCLDGVVEAELRLVAYGGVAMSTNPDIAFSIGWDREYPTPGEINMLWHAGTNRLAAGAVTSTVYDIVEFSKKAPYVKFNKPEFRGVFVDFSIPENKQVFKEVADRYSCPPPCRTFTLLEAGASEEIRSSANETLAPGVGIGIGMEFSHRVLDLRSGSFDTRW
jgi:hypothetical protein